MKDEELRRDLALEKEKQKGRMQERELMGGQSMAETKLREFGATGRERMGTKSAERIAQWREEGETGRTKMREAGASSRVGEQEATKRSALRFEKERWPTEVAHKRRELDIEQQLANAEALKAGTPIGELTDFDAGIRKPVALSRQTGKIIGEGNSQLEEPLNWRQGLTETPATPATPAMSVPQAAQVTTPQAGTVVPVAQQPTAISTLGTGGPANKIGLWKSIKDKTNKKLLNKFDLEWGF